MKALIVFTTLLVSLIASASERYEGTFYSKHIGVMVLRLELDFNQGEYAQVMNDFYHERFDGQWGDWVCENKAVFHKTLVIKGAVYRGNGDLLGTFQNNKADQRKGKLIASERKTSPESFDCSILSLKNVKEIWFQGYDANIGVKEYSVTFKLDGSFVGAEVADLGENVYSLNRVDIKGIIKNSRNQIQYSVLVDKDPTTNLDNGFVKFKDQINN